jgi:signal recognition particle receptor subunit beta
MSRRSSCGRQTARDGTLTLTIAGRLAHREDASLHRPPHLLPSATRTVVMLMLLLLLDQQNPESSCFCISSLLLNYTASLMSETTEQPKNDEIPESPSANADVDIKQPPSPAIPFMMDSNRRMTQIRQAITPYLPPPVIQGMQQADILLTPYIGPEPTITILSTLLLGFVLWQFVKILSHSITGARAIVEEDEEEQERKQVSDKEFKETLLLCGPSNAGKTRLFYELCHNRSNVPTLTSMKMNVDVSDDGIRFMDYPGHRSALGTLVESLLKENSHSSRIHIVLVLDSSQPVQSAADILFQLLHVAHSFPRRISVFVACHKCDLSNAKNHKRIRIQLRTELERMLKLASTTSSGDDDDQHDLWWPPGKPLDMEHIGTLHLAHLEFNSTSCENQKGMDELRAFCEGKVPEIEVL